MNRSYDMTIDLDVCVRHQRTDTKLFFTVLAETHINDVREHIHVVMKIPADMRVVMLIDRADNTGRTHHVPIAEDAESYRLSKYAGTAYDRSRGNEAPPIMHISCMLRPCNSLAQRKGLIVNMCS